MTTYFNCHAHTMFSNIRLLDSINRPEALVNTSKELGLSGLAITDHEALSAHIVVNKLAKKMRETNPDFTIALGNEIYLTDTREKKQKYYHFILIAKDAEGYKQLKRLSSQAWLNSYEYGRLERVPTLKNELKEVINQNKGHIIATSACMGGELSTNALLFAKANQEEAQLYYDNINTFISYCLELFGEDFYIECAPSTDNEQVLVNQTLYKISQARNIPMVVGTDAHYLRPKDRAIHKAYLTSKEGDRETDKFYQYTYVMSPEEVKELMKYSFDDENIIDTIFINSQNLQKKISWFSLERKQIIPKVQVKEYSKSDYRSYFGVNNNYADELEGAWSIIKELGTSNEPQERYWINQCLAGLINKGLWKEEYITRICEEADVIKYIGNQLEDCLFAYFNTFQHYIDLFWGCGSIVGPGRGSATGFLSNYLLGITQLDPIRWDLPAYRFLNKERAELPSLMLILGSCKKRMLTIA